eukprot:6238171-Alexandrium_andersonii.AAC.1
MTCAAHGASKMHRRDYILVSAMLLPLAASFNTVVGAGYDVHLPVCARFRCPRKCLERQLIMPQPYVQPDALTSKAWRHELEVVGQLKFDEAKPQLEQSLAY